MAPGAATMGNAASAIQASRDFAAVMKRRARVRRRTVTALLAAWPTEGGRMSVISCTWTHPELGPCVYGRAHKVPYHTVDVSEPPVHRGTHTYQEARFRHFDYNGVEVQVDEHGRIIDRG